MTTSLGSRALSEIVERHRFFERWFNGDAQENEFAASLRRFDPLFLRIDPAGVEMDRAALEIALSARRGSRRADPLRIVVEKPQLVWQSSQAALATYVEAQSTPSAPVPARRRSTAFFLSFPNGDLLWRHVQETSIPTPNQLGGATLSAIIPGDGI